MLLLYNFLVVLQNSSSLYVEINVMCLCTCAITYQVFDEMIVRVLFNHICRFGSCSDWGKFFLVEKCGNFKLPYLFDFHT